MTRATDFLTDYLTKLANLVVELWLYLTPANVAAIATAIAIALFLCVDWQPKVTSDGWTEPEEDRPRTGFICLIGVMLASTASLYLSQGLYLSPRWFWLAALFASILLIQMILLSFVGARDTIESYNPNRY